MPTPVVGGRHDEAIPCHHRDGASRASPGSEWVIFENSSHLPHAEETERYLQVLGSIFERCRGAGVARSPVPLRLPHTNQRTKSQEVSFLSTNEPEETPRRDNHQYFEHLRVSSWIKMQPAAHSSESRSRYLGHQSCFTPFSTSLHQAASRHGLRYDGDKADDPHTTAGTGDGGCS